MRFWRGSPRIYAKELDGADLLAQDAECLLELTGRSLLDRGIPALSWDGREESWRIVDCQAIDEDQVDDHECRNGHLRSWMAQASREGIHRLARAPEASPHPPRLCVGGPSPGDCWNALLDEDPGSEENSRTPSMYPPTRTESGSKGKAHNVDAILPR
jgi:hypothetical protein